MKMGWKRVSIVAVAFIVSGAALVLASDSTRVYLNTPLSIIGPDGVCKKVTNASATGLSEYIPTQSIAEWQSFVAHPPAGGTLSSCSITVPSGTNTNLCAIAGNPSTAGNYTFTIDTGTIIGSNDTAQPALTTGTCWAPGSTLTLINYGYIEGMGGSGGAGGYGGPGGGGGTGGPAISLAFALAVDSTNGYILGGGGGGGGGGSVVFRGIYGGGSGGIGQGYGAYASGPGGGSGGTSIGSTYGGTGGTGGVWGSAGNTGGMGGLGGAPNRGFSGGAGGAAGNAVSLNGNAVTWLGGNDGTHVKGAVQ